MGSAALRGGERRLRRRSGALAARALAETDLASPIAGEPLRHMLPIIMRIGTLETLGRPCASASLLMDSISGMT